MIRPTRTRHIPANSVKVCDKHSDAIAYAYTDGRGRPCVIVYFDKQTKPVLHAYYRTEAARESEVRTYFSRAQSHIRRKAESAAERAAPIKLEIGDILNTCWGYDQTNREFYEVTEIAGRHVVIRQIGTVRDGDWSGKVVPQSGEFVGEPMRKLVNYGDSVKISKGITATKWNTGRVAGVPVGPALHFSSYA